MCQTVFVTLEQEKVEKPPRDSMGTAIIVCRQSNRVLLKKRGLMHA